MFEIRGENASAYVYAAEVENSALDQIAGVLDHPSFKGERICIMPDCHGGKGCVIGFTATYSKSIVPNLVGVDIGCGMLAVNVGRDEIDLEALDAAAAQVPWGFAKNAVPVESDFRYGDLVCAESLGERRIRNAMLSLGSVGGGNHFVECGVDGSGSHWLIVHSGSRGFGNAVAVHWQNRAREAHPEMHPDLAFLEGEEMQGYLNDVHLAANWASLNRREIASKVLRLAGLNAQSSFETIHNYVDVENSIVRKGAIAAYAGQTVLIPLNMRDGSLICIGRGNPDWNFSAPHGAGRKMSRGEARRTIQMDDFRESMNGIYTSSVCESTIDEAPFAYKDAGAIESLIDGEAVDVVEHVRPLWNMKAH